jgi:tagaturonate epimerase
MVNELFTPETYLLYPSSCFELDGNAYELYRNRDGQKAFKVIGSHHQFCNPLIKFDDIGWFSCNTENLAILKKSIPWLNPSIGGLELSAGTGDRLGLATPGHIRALKSRQIFPNFAQQSVRELLRTNRSAVQVLDDATWGVFQEGWRGTWGADADHLKSVEEAKAFIDAGFTYFTIDAGDCVQDIGQVFHVEDLESYFPISGSMN